MGPKRGETHLHGVGAPVAGLDEHPGSIFDQLPDMVRRERGPPFPDRLVLSPDCQHLAADAVVLRDIGGTVILWREGGERVTGDAQSSHQHPPAEDSIGVYGQTTGKAFTARCKTGTDIGKSRRKSQVAPVQNSSLVSKVV